VSGPNRNSRRHLFLADALSKLKPASDTSLFFVRALLKKGDEVFWATPSDLAWNGWGVKVQAQKLGFCTLGELPSSEQSEGFSVGDFHAVWIRKDPPFDENYLKMCWLLEPYESSVQMFNRPSLLIRHHEKMIPWQMLQEKMIGQESLLPMLVSPKAHELESFVKDFPSTHYVVKPWLGFAGHSVSKLGSKDLIEWGRSPQFHDQNWIVQVYTPEIETAGDCRVLFWQGKKVGHFVRRPAAGHFVSNLAQGGSAESVNLSAAQDEIVRKLEAWLTKHSIDFAGADLIGPYLNEVNITSPTGLATVLQLEGKDVAEEICSWMP
jgi:glutathione synthase